jgi:hypothetical protein
VRNEKPFGDPPPNRSRRHFEELGDLRDGEKFL